MKSLLTSFRTWLLGAPQNPLNPDTQRHIALIAFLAWVGLGADGLSSSCYGPEQAFLALGTHAHLALYIAFATAATVFIISLAYNQVIELFPSGGGGYKVATQLLGPYAGLVSGAALIVDYVLTITISTASGMDAIFSLLPDTLLSYEIWAEIGVIILLIALNMRGMKESIKILMPIFVGFVITHVGLILWGIYSHKTGLPAVAVDTVYQTHHLTQQVGWLFVIALLLRSYSLGSGTYTGLEAVSNNVNRLAEPKVRTGKWTMLYMAVSLSFTASGIILLYLLWNVQPVTGETLNAVVFHAILGSSPLGHAALFLTLLLEAGLLFVGANTGFLAGPSVLANMSIDNWMPNRFRHLSSRLVTQNGIVIFGLAALAILLWSKGSVAWLVVLYSINVFLTFSMSILGLCVYWWRQREKASLNWRWRLVFSLFACCVTGSILLVTLFSKFTAGGWVTVVITGAVVSLCLLIKRYYTRIAGKLSNVDTLLRVSLHNANTVTPPPLDPNQPTAVFLIGPHQGLGMHTLLWVIRMFPGHFKNFVFLRAGIVDVESFRGKDALQEMQKEVGENLHYFVSYCHSHGFAAEAYSAYGTDPVVQLAELAEKAAQKFSNCIFFATKLIFERENWLTRLLHNETSVTLQRRLHARNLQLVLLPMRIG
jgi:amino acid transporter